MFHKILIAVVASLGMLSPFALPSESEARDFHIERHHHHYRVYYRDCSHEPWRVHGSYHHREDAFRAARHLRMRGFETFVR